MEQVYSEQAYSFQALVEKQKRDREQAGLLLKDIQEGKATVFPHVAAYNTLVTLGSSDQDGSE